MLKPPLKVTLAKHVKGTLNLYKNKCQAVLAVWLGAPLKSIQGLEVLVLI